jgi:general secretion pathway protein D
VDAEAIRDELQALLPIMGLPVTDKANSGGEIKLTALPRLQVLIVSAALPEVVAEVEQWIQKLDQENTAEQEKIFFYNVRHSTADRLTEALGVFFNTSGASSTKASSTKSTSTKAAKPGETQPPAAGAPPKPAARSGQREAGIRKTVFDSPVVIYTDTDQNRLTFRTSQRTGDAVKLLLGRLDLPTRQVLIRAIIAEITLNKSTEFGFSYAAATQWQNMKAKGAVVNTGAVAAGADLVGLKYPTSGAAFLFQNANADEPLAFVRAVAGETNTKAISAPQIVAANDQQAVINVGDKVPIITQDYTNTSSTGSTNRTYQYTDTGTILTVTPHITAGNEVALDVIQEASLADKDASLSDQIIIRNRKLETKLVVPDGGTVLMGGLIKTSNITSHVGVPWLKDIPLFGRLFRTNRTEQNRTEILVIMTVNVLSPESDIGEVAAKFQAALKEIRDNLGQF